MMIASSIALGLSFVSAPLTVSSTYRIEEVRSTSVYAGRLGRRVTGTLVLADGGKRIEVVLSPYHTRMARSARALIEGATVSVPEAAVRSGHALRDDVRKVRG